MGSLAELYSASMGLYPGAIHELRRRTNNEIDEIRLINQEPSKIYSSDN